MKELFLITQREYLSHVRKKSFVILTLLMPILFIGSMCCVPLVLSQMKDTKGKHIGIIDNTQLYAPLLQSNDVCVFDVLDSNQDEMFTKIGDDMFGILQINGDLSANPNAVTFFSTKHTPSELLIYLEKTLSTIIKNKNIEYWAKDNGVNVSLVHDLQAELEKSLPVDIKTVRLDDDVEREASNIQIATISILPIFLMLMVVGIYGTMVLTSVTEEKSSRIIEVLVCTVKPFYLMMGKIIGVGLTAVTQLLIWFAFVLIVFFVGVLFITNFSLTEIAANSQWLDLNLLGSFNWVQIIVFFALFFIGGYLFYASLFAMFGSLVDNAQEAQQFTIPIMFVFIISFYVASFSINDPDGSLAFWGSIIPFSSPLVMMARIPSGVPLWQILLSLLILYISAVYMVKFAAKIYRIGILIHGKKVSLKTIITSIKSK